MLESFESTDGEGTEVFVSFRYRGLVIKSPVPNAECDFSKFEDLANELAALLYGPYYV